MTAWRLAIATLPLIGAGLVVWCLVKLARARAVDRGIAAAIGGCVTGATLPTFTAVLGVPMPDWLPMLLATGACLVCACLSVVSIILARRAALARETAARERFEAAIAERAAALPAVLLTDRPPSELTEPGS